MLVLVDVLLAQQDDVVEPLVELALDDQTADVLGPVVGLLDRDWLLPLACLGLGIGLRVGRWLRLGLLCRLVGGLGCRRLLGGGGCGWLLGGSGRGWLLGGSGCGRLLGGSSCRWLLGGSGPGRLLGGGGG